MDNDVDLTQFNNKLELDFMYHYERHNRDAEPDTDPFLSRTIMNSYYDMYTLQNVPNIEDIPIYLSVNIQSINSKFEQLKFQITELLSKNIKIDVIAIQETWEISV